MTAVSASSSRLRKRRASLAPIDQVRNSVDAYLEHHIKVHGSTYAAAAVQRQVVDTGQLLAQAEERLPCTLMWC